MAFARVLALLCLSAAAAQVVQIDMTTPSATGALLWVTDTPTGVLDSSNVTWLDARDSGIRGAFELNMLNIQSAGFDVRRMSFMLNASRTARSAKLTVKMWSKVDSATQKLAESTCE